jgi:hypothetical protein
MTKPEIKKAVCETLEDLQRIIKPYLRDVNTHKKTITTEIAGEMVIGEDGGSSAQEVLTEGFQLIKRRQEAFEKLKNEGLDSKVPLICDIEKTRFNVDGFIENSLGGKRIGLRIRWVIREGTFEFDPLAKKMWQVDK